MTLPIESAFVSSLASSGIHYHASSTALPSKLLYTLIVNDNDGPVCHHEYLCGEYIWSQLHRYQSRHHLHNGQKSREHTSITLWSAPPSSKSVRRGYFTRAKGYRLSGGRGFLLRQDILWYNSSLPLSKSLNMFSSEHRTQIPLALVKEIFRHVTTCDKQNNVLANHLFIIGHLTSNCYV